MKKNKKMKTSNYADRRELRSKRTILTWLIVGCLTVILTGAPLIGTTRFVDAKSAGIAKLTPPDHPLNAQAAAEFGELLMDETENALDDFLDLDGVNSTKNNIAAKFNGRGSLSGMTRKQIADLFYADAKTVVTDKEVLDRIWSNVSAVVNGNDSSPAVASSTPEPVKGMNVTEVEYGNNGQASGGAFRQVGDKSETV